MIIKYTFNDNDFTQIIEKYLEEYGPLYAFNYNSISELDRFKELITMYDDYNDKYNNVKDISKDEFEVIKENIIESLYKNFKNYIDNISLNSNWHTIGFDAKNLQENKEYILDNIKINLVKSIPDQWEDGEIVYFIISNEKYITM